MGLWSKVKNAVKKAAKAVANAVKGFVRFVARLVVEVAHRVINFVGALVAYNKLKHLRVHIVVLHEPGKNPLVTEQEAESSLQRASVILEDKFKTRLHGFGKPHVTTLKEDAPSGALNVECSASGYFAKEYGEGGSFFASHLAGWNGAPVTFVYPITVFVIANVTHDGSAWRGCSWGILSDYVVLSPDGMNDDTTLAHEIGHACSLLHRDDKNNLMYHGFSRGKAVTGWQQFWFRTSRHVNFY